MPDRCTSLPLPSRQRRQLRCFQRVRHRCSRWHCYHSQPPRSLQHPPRHTAKRSRRGRCRCHHLVHVHHRPCRWHQMRIHRHPPSIRFLRCRRRRSHQPPSARHQHHPQMRRSPPTRHHSSQHHHQHMRQTARLQYRTPLLHSHLPIPQTHLHSCQMPHLRPHRSPHACSRRYQHRSSLLAHRCCLRPDHHLRQQGLH